MEQGGVDTKALLGHKTDAIADLYANSRGLELLQVKIGTRCQPARVGSDKAARD
jgi:enterobacteria phage integrase